jgi:hypothetical protein
LRRIDLIAGQEFNQFVSHLPDWTGWLATLVASEEGSLVGPNGDSKAIGNHVDLQLLLALRSKADVILTTGKTARVESYKSSRFAPIAFLTTARAKLEGVPAVMNPGEHENIYLVPPAGVDPISWAQTQLERLGCNSILFEGGPSTLEGVWNSASPVQLVFSIANSREPDEVAPESTLKKALPWITDADLADDLLIGHNRVTRWMNSAQ